MASVRKLVLSWAVVAPLVGLTGCGDSDVVEVTGTLTHKGKPVPNALLTFEPSHGRQSWAETDAEGRFKIFYDKHRDGAVIGQHKVFLEYQPATDAEREAVMAGKPPPMTPEMKALFARYSPLKSKLTVEITRDTKDLKLDLD
jgi:hypothetical protein